MSRLLRVERRVVGHCSFLRQREFWVFLRVRTLICSLAVRRCTVLRPIPVKTRQILFSVFRGCETFLLRLEAQRTEHTARDYCNCNVSSKQRDGRWTSVWSLPSGSGIPNSCQRRSTTSTSVCQWSYSGMCWKASAGSDSRNSVYSLSSGEAFESSSKNRS